MNQRYMDGMSRNIKNNLLVGVALLLLGGILFNGKFQYNNGFDTGYDTAKNKGFKHLRFDRAGKNRVEVSYLDADTETNEDTFFRVTHWMLIDTLEVAAYGESLAVEIQRIEKYLQKN